MRALQRTVAGTESSDTIIDSWKTNCATQTCKPTHETFPPATLTPPPPPPPTHVDITLGLTGCWRVMAQLPADQRRHVGRVRLACDNIQDGSQLGVEAEARDGQSQRAGRKRDCSARCTANSTVTPQTQHSTAQQYEPSGAQTEPLPQRQCQRATGVHTRCTRQQKRQLADGLSECH